jgi:hypothetical protein
VRLQRCISLARIRAPLAGFRSEAYDTLTGTIRTIIRNVGLDVVRECSNAMQIVSNWLQNTSVCSMSHDHLRCRGPSEDTPVAFQRAMGLAFMPKPQQRATVVVSRRCRKARVSSSTQRLKVFFQSWSSDDVFPEDCLQLDYSHLEPYQISCYSLR